MATVVWFRRDLRLRDHPALHAAAARGQAVVPLFVWDTDAAGAWAPGSAHRWWLDASLRSLSDELSDASLRLVIRIGDTVAEVGKVMSAVGAEALHFQTDYAPHAHALGGRVRTAIEREGHVVRAFAGQLLHEPDAVRTGKGDPYRVFTPFWKRARQQLSVSEPLPKPVFKSHHRPGSWPPGLEISNLGLSPQHRDGVDWAAGLRETWTPGEKTGLEYLRRFVNETLLDYPDGRNIPGEELTSRLSPYLHHGEVSPRQVWHAVNSWVSNGTTRRAADVFLSEIGWREFGYHVLHHFPQTDSQPLRDKFSAFNWRDDASGLSTWQKGATGYPLVDAGMRQLWQTGWMHNRVRMIVASFLTKDQMIPWQRGAEWFWDTLVDADLANNSLGWQWTAGCGADAQPFFRIFNPVSQGKKFDSDGAYVRRWCPELRDLPNKYIHAPWEAPDSALEAAGVVLGTTYPPPLVDHGEARKAALSAYNEIK